MKKHSNPLWTNTTYESKPAPKKAEETPVRKTQESALGFRLGQKVMHSKFGKGMVVGMQGDKLDIAFDQGGIKKVMEEYLQKA